MDEDGRELLERRLADRVETRVRPRIFGFYAALGSLVLGVLGFFGYNVVAGLEGAARDSARGYAEQYAREVVAPIVEQARGAARQAGDEAQRIAARIDALDDFQSRREAALIDGEHRVERNQARVNQLAQEIEQRLEEIVARLAETQQQVQNAQETMQATQEAMRATESELAVQQARLRDVAGVGSFGELAETLAGLSGQVKLLAQELREVREWTGGPDAEMPLADARQIETIQRIATAQAQAAYEAKPGGDSLAGAGAGSEGIGGGDTAANTVYFQFAEAPREVVEEISDRLRPLGFEVPGEERIKTAAGLHEVRFFFEEDRPRAEALAEATNAILRDSGYRAEVGVRDLIGFAGQKPRPGTLELWLEPAPAG